MNSLTRRRWLVEALALTAVPGMLRALEPGEETLDFLDDEDFQTELQAANPRVKCYDLRRLREPLTPIGEFFVFHQTSVPPIDAGAWRLEIGGFVDRPVTLTLEELARTVGPREEVEFTLECAGNLPRPEIMNGQVGNARWSGFNLASVLRTCGVRAAAREVVFFAADQVRDSAGVAYGPHGRSVFVQDILESDALLATHMNGEPLTPEHGFPLRLILPGWYGMAQIKWLTRIELLDRRYEGPHMSRNYHSLHVLPGNDPAGQLTVETSISRTRLKSVAVRVTRTKRDHDSLYKVSGAAWGGAVRIARVEVKVDDRPWAPAQIDERRGTYSWLMWSCAFADLPAGRHTVTSRAIDATGAVQPTPEEWKRGIKSARENNAQWERSFRTEG